MTDESGNRIHSRVETEQRVTGRRDISNENGIIAREILFDEIGINGPSARGQAYSMDPDARDTLIAHGRQDAAHALLNTMTLISEIASLRRLVIMLLWLNIIILVMLWVTSHR